VWQALSRNVTSCLRNFFRLPLLAEIRKTASEHWSIEHWRQGCSTSRARRSGSPRLRLLDRRGPPRAHRLGRRAPPIPTRRLQLGCYALYAKDMLGVDPEKVDLVEVNLREPTVTPHRWDGARLADIGEQLRLSIRG